MIMIFRASVVLNRTVVALFINLIGQLKTLLVVYKLSLDFIGYEDSRIYTAL